MPRASRALATLPPRAREAVARLGDDLKLARVKRGWSLREAAGRLRVTVATLRRLEAGQPGASLGVAAHALFLYGMVDRLALVADPAFDLRALGAERRRARGEPEPGFDV